MRVGTESICTDYPQPRIPVLPVVSWGACFGRRRPHPPSVLQAGWKVDVARGAAAIALALQHGGIEAGDRVLLPAFHCHSMIEPFLAAGVQPIYYRIKEDLSVDLKDIRSKLDGHQRALLVAHYFGLFQDMQALRSLCDRQRVILIEDCAHTFFGAINGHPVGWYGDYAIVSARKFFAIQDGGYLVSARHPLRELGVKNAGVVFNIKSPLDGIETALAYGRLAPLSLALSPLISLKSYLWDKVKVRDGAAASIGPHVSKGYKSLDLAWTHRAMSLASRWLIRLAPQASIADQRRAHYRRLVSGLSGLPRARPLFPQLPGGVVPYMFPLLVDDPKSSFHVLKCQGVPIWRWEDLASNECEISRRYSQCLFQLPCHQTLRDREVDWMIHTIRKTISGEA